MTSPLLEPKLDSVKVAQALKAPGLRPAEGLLAMDKGKSRRKASELTQTSLSPPADWKKLRRGTRVEVYHGYSILIDDTGRPAVLWREGRQSDATLARYRLIVAAFEGGYFRKSVQLSGLPEWVMARSETLTDPQVGLLGAVVDSIGPSRGRALVTNLLLQLAVKAVAPNQDVRLHKGSRNESTFSWQEGISMRTLGSQYVGPVLAENGLIRMNESGAMMTRTFAENSPMHLFYKPRIRPEIGRQAWLQLLDQLEAGMLDPEGALAYTLGRLWEATDAFEVLAGELQDVVSSIGASVTCDDMVTLLSSHFDASSTPARLLEVAMHSLLQSVEDLSLPSAGRLQRLMPMRTANLKHSNIGDVELRDDGRVVEAWDAKFGITTLVGAIHGLEQKVSTHVTSGLVVGFVCHPRLPTDGGRTLAAAKVLEARTGLTVQIVTFEAWADSVWKHAAGAGATSTGLGQAWLRAYSDSLAQRRRERAPIDEPSLVWVATLLQILSSAAGPCR